MKFNKVVCVDNTKLKDWAFKELQNLSEEELSTFNDYPESGEEILKRIGDAEAVFVSWHTQIDKEVIEKCPNLKYIGMCCSLYDDESANVAVDFARKRGIVVKGIRDYGIREWWNLLFLNLYVYFMALEIFNGRRCQWNLPIEK